MATLTAAQVVEIARQLFRSQDYAFLVTTSDTGEANARLMQHYEPEKDLTLWFGASPRSRKCRELSRDARATVAVVDPKEHAYVTLIGTAQVVTDLALRRRYWREGWEQFFPGGPEGEDYVLLRFAPARLEIVYFAKGIAPPPYGLQPGVLSRGAAGWEIEVL